MTERQEFVRSWCDGILESLSKRLSSNNEEVKSEYSLPLSVLQNLYIEVRSMKKTLDPDFYIPMYPRFLLDSWEGYELVDELLRLAYEYERIRKRGKFRQGLPTSEPDDKNRGR
jgi:hypothetical protein